MKILRILAIVIAFVALLGISAAIAQLVISPPVSDVNINGHTYTNSMLQSNPAGWLGGVANDVGLVTSAYPTGRFSPRTKLTAALDMYVSASGGSDANNCLVSAPCQTIQRPLDILRDGYDLANNVVTVHLADGTYTPGFHLVSKLLGQGLGGLNVIGNLANPQNVTISDTRTTTADPSVGSPVYVGYGGDVSVRGVTLVSSFRSVWAASFGLINIGNARFGPAGNCHIAVDQAAKVNVDGNYTIYSGAPQHLCAFNGGMAIVGSGGNVVQVTLSGSPSFGFAFAYASVLSQIVAGSTTATFTGSAASGARYYTELNAVIRTNGSGASFFPGTSAGVAATGGIYN